MASDSGIQAPSDGGDVASQIPFHDLCALMEKIHKTQGTDKKKKILSSFIERWRETHARLHHTDAATTTDTFFAIMRLLLPELDRARPAYGMKETALAKHYIEVLNISKESTDAQKLLHYRAPQIAKEEAGDFADVAYFVLKSRCPEKGSLTVAQVNQYLDDLANGNTSKDRAGMKKALQLLLRNTSALEQKWLIRIILKGLKTGLSENSVFSVFHPDAVDLFSVCSNLEKVCTDLHDASVHLNESIITYFSAFRPMLGERATMDQVLRLMEHQPFFIQTKYDGDRMQLHKQGNQYRYFSRSSHDYTASFGASPSEGTFTPHIHQTFSSKVNSCILDGEMVGWDPETESFVPKGENVDVKTVGGTDGGPQQCYVVFDVLMINDTNLANCPLRDRLEQLKKVFEPVRGYLHQADVKEGSTKEDLVAALNDAIDRREEGLMVKHPGATYRPDKRKGSGWVKIKPEYVGNLSDQLDVVIIGGYFGQGHRSGMISHFMCGVAVPPENPGDRPSVFHSFCKVGSGYTMVELRALGQKLKPHWRQFDTRNPPSCVLLANGFKEKPDLWIDPQNSVIVQIRAAEIVVSDRYKCGCTLRFPRLEKVRTDKEWYDCMTVDELEQLKSMGSGRLAYQHLDGSEDQPATKRRKTASLRIEKPRGVASQFKQTDVSDVEKVSKMFEGKELCVINGPPGTSKEDLERKIAEHGGTFVQNPGPKTFCVVVHSLVVRAKNVIKTGLYDVVKADWLQQCLDEGQSVPFLPHHMLHTSAATTNVFAQLYDMYGDSFTEDATDESLRETFNKVGEKHAVRITQEEIALIESRYFPDESPWGLFRQCKFYLDRFAEIGNSHTAILTSPLELTALEVQLHGGVVTEDFDESVTHAVCNMSDVSRIPRLRAIERGHTHKHHFVTTEWVRACIQRSSLVDERIFEPVY